MQIPDPHGETSPKTRVSWCQSCIAITLLTLAALAVAILVNLDLGLAADYCLVALIGIATGATELMSRYRDRPLAVVVSAPGLSYMAINAGAAVLAFFILVEWGWFGGDPIKRVLVAGVSAMTVFRAGLFTAKIGNQEVALGPNLILKVVLDVLDREYDRASAFRRSAIIIKAMGGIDFDQAQTALTELCISLMQNVSEQERQALREEIKRIGGLDGATQGEAKAMALGLSLMGIVGEDTLVAAATNLGPSIVGFRDLSPELGHLLLKRRPEDVLESLYELCNELVHGRLRISSADIGKRQELVKALGLPELVAARVLAFQARQFFGETVVKAALEMLPAPPETVPPAPPPPPPSPSNPDPAPEAAREPGGGESETEEQAGANGQEGGGTT